MQRKRAIISVDRVVANDAPSFISIFIESMCLPSWWSQPDMPVSATLGQLLVTFRHSTRGSRQRSVPTLSPISVRISRTPARHCLDFAFGAYRSTSGMRAIYCHAFRAASRHRTDRASAPNKLVEPTGARRFLRDSFRQPYLFSIRRLLFSLVHLIRFRFPCGGSRQRQAPFD